MIDNEGLLHNKKNPDSSGSKDGSDTESVPTETKKSKSGASPGTSSTQQISSTTGSKAAGSE